MLDNLAPLDPDSFDLVPLNLGPLPKRQFDQTNIRDKFLNTGGGRIDRAEVRKRAASAMARKLPPHLKCLNESPEWAIIGGGPSINACLPEIRRLKRNGANIVSVNKSHDWLLENGVTPWGHILLDPMEWVADYVKRPRNDVRYFVASQCHDKAFESLDGFPVFLWHAGQDFPVDPLNPDGPKVAEPSEVLREKWPKTPWQVVPGPTTVGLRSIFLGATMGATKFRLFGLDSSRTPNGPLHGYAKPEAPDAQPGKLKLKHENKKFTFDTNSHMARQQFDFDKMIGELPEHVRKGHLPRSIDLTVHGSGLLPTFAAMHGLHADPECNADPSKVGGYVDVAPAYLEVVFS